MMPDRGNADGKGATVVATLMTGVDADGKSCGLRRRGPTLDRLAPSFAVGIPYATTSPPPGRSTEGAPLIDPGIVGWTVVDLVAGSESPLHHTAGSDGCRPIGTPPPDPHAPDTEASSR